MENFEFYNPTKVVFGKGQIERLKDLVPKTRVLMLFGEGSIKTNGVYDQVKNALSSHEIIECGGVQANPTYEKAMEVLELIKKEKIDFILAVGGGSVIDTAKFLSLAAFFPGTPWSILTNREQTYSKALPFACVLTLPATGSEMNCYFVLSRGDEKLSGGHSLLYPVFSILDPSVSFTLSQKQVGNGVVDAFVHVLEQYLTYPAQAPLQDRFAESVLKTLIEEGPKSYSRLDNYEARANHMWCATMALSSVFGVGVPQDWSTHQIGHELTALYGIDHARTLAIVLPAMLWSMRNEKRQKLMQYAERVWDLKGSDEELIQRAIRRTSDFFESLGLPTKLLSYDLKENPTEKVIARLLARGFTPMGEKQQVTLEKVREVLEFAKR